MKNCPKCKTHLELINMIMVCPTCGYYHLIGKRKSRIKVQNWVDYLIDKKK